jgi:hypothetical protein
MKADKLDEGITTKQMLSRLKAEVKLAGSQIDLANKWGISYQSISNALSGSKLPSPTMLSELGLKPIKTINYRYEDLK